MEWEEIYDANPSRVLKTLASTISSYFLVLIRFPPSNQIPGKGSWNSQSGVAPDHF